MNVLFLTLLSFDSIQERTIYTDLLREFVKNGHNVYAISPVEKRQNKESHIIQEDHVTILRLKVGNIQKTNIIEKGISTVMIEPTFKKAIKEYFSNVKFDLVLYSTPPITIVSAVEYVKKRDGAKSYLLLKDIFPQNAIDIGLISKNGLKGLLYKHFRRQEKKLYHISDRIGCMSPANVKYVLDHNTEVRGRDDESRRESGSGIVEVCPNSIEVIDKSVDERTRTQIRSKYGIPEDKIVFIYGGNLGRPQGIPFMLECLRKCEDVEQVFFLIVGDGTEAHLVQEYLEADKPNNVKYLKRLPKEDYDNMVGACDVGLIFLDHCFTIPNFPSRLLSYMQAKVPVLAVTDPNTDVGKIIVDGGFGWWCKSDDADSVRRNIAELVGSDTVTMGRKGYDFLKVHFDVANVYQIIMEFIPPNEEVY